MAALSHQLSALSPELSSRSAALRSPSAEGRQIVAGRLIGDARILHATNSNESSGRRTVITLWFQPDYDNLPLKTQAQMLLKYECCCLDRALAVLLTWESLTAQDDGHP